MQYVSQEAAVEYHVRPLLEPYRSHGHGFSIGWMKSAVGDDVVLGRSCGATLTFFGC